MKFTHKNNTIRRTAWGVVCRDVANLMDYPIYDLTSSVFLDTVDESWNTLPDSIYEQNFTK